jgi:hypothetical protein
MCVYFVFVLFCVYVAALRRADPPSKESYRLCIGLINWKAAKVQRAVEPKSEIKRIPILGIPAAVVLDYGTSEMENNKNAASEAPNHNKLHNIMQ